MIDATTGRALADLGRARLERVDAGRDRAPGPSGAQLRGGTPLRRRAPEPEGRGRWPAIERRTGFRYLPRPSCRRTTRRSTRSASGSSRCSGTCGRLTIERREPLPRVGLHGRERREHRRAAAPHPRRRVRRSSATRRWTTSRSRAMRRRSQSRRSRTSRPPRIRSSPGACRGRSRSRATSQPNCEPGGAFELELGRPAEPERHLHGELQLRHPASGGRSPTPGRPQVYGHGLLGTRGQATSGDQQILGPDATTS